MKVYKILEGEITELVSDAEIYKFSKECDWTDSSLVIANSADDALLLADLYDKGCIQADNVFWPDCYGQTIVAIM
jgi:hypothetical protein